MFKKIILIVLLSLFLFSSMDFVDANTWNLWSDIIKKNLLWTSESKVLEIEEENWLNVLQSIVIWVKDSLSGLLVLIAVGVFLFIWIRLGVARWNPEEFKKWIMQLVYAVVWIFIVSIAWAAVTLVAWLNL